jgi:phage FluMu protein Com
MPIRFRCAYCNQLLGIARRKAGQVVRCPTCAGQVVVPSPEEVGEEANAEAGAPGAPGPPVFERSDFDEVFQVPSPPAPPLPVTEGPAPPPVNYNVEPLVPPPPPAPPPPPPAGNPPVGILLSPALATVLTVVAIVLVAVAFGAGLLVGLALKGGAPEPSHSSAAGGAGRATAAPGAPAAGPVEQLVQGRQVQRRAPDQHDGGLPHAQRQRAGAAGHDPRVTADVKVEHGRPDGAAGDGPG